MKILSKLFLYMFLMFFFGIASAQNSKKQDSVFFLVDRAKPLSSDGMWKMDTTGVYKHFTIKCPCLKFNGMPTFAYLKGRKGTIENALRLKKRKLTNLADLIVISKDKLEKKIDGMDTLFFLIEPAGKNYTIHEVVLRNSETRIVSLPDVITLPPDTSAFALKGITIVPAGKLEKHRGEMVSTSGRVTSIVINYITKMMIIGAAGNDSSTDFVIMLNAANRDKFDMPDNYLKGKMIKVAGTVIQYNGKPAVEISNPNQLQVMRPDRKTKNHDSKNDKF